MYGRQLAINGNGVGLVLSDTEEKLMDEALGKVLTNICEKMVPEVPTEEDLIVGLEEAGYSTLYLVFEQPFRVDGVCKE